MEIRTTGESRKLAGPFLSSASDPIHLHTWPPTESCKLTLWIVIAQRRNNLLCDKIAWRDMMPPSQSIKIARQTFLEYCAETARSEPIEPAPRSKPVQVKRMGGDSVSCLKWNDRDV